MRCISIFPSVISCYIDFTTCTHHRYENITLTTPCIANLGTISPDRKLAIISRKTKDTLCVTKLAISENASRQIRYEAEILNQLQLKNLHLMPKLLKVTEDASIQEYLSGTPVQASITTYHISFLKKLHLNVNINIKDYFNEKIIPLIETMPEKKRRMTLLKLLEKFEIPDASIMTTIVHGDFAPWNLKLDASNQLLAFDWEDCIMMGLPLHDLYHAHLIFYYVKVILNGSKAYQPLKWNSIEKSYIQHHKLSDHEHTLLIAYLSYTIAVRNNKNIQNDTYQDLLIATLEKAL